MNVKVYALIERLMVCLDEVKNAAVYHVHLFIGDWNRRIEIVNGIQTVVDDKKQKMQEIALIDVDRNYKYCSFKNLARIHVTHTSTIYGPTYGRMREETGLEYYVLVEAEDRQGNVIDSSDKVSGRVLSMDNGYATQG